ncbi:MAG: glycosyltransferase [Candidatus Kerfeldbacteria bacterium]|nr:glycosyltransferase [Candidatus Kerfeldbacteria bacterium]
MGYHFGTGDSYSYYLRQQGYEVIDVIADNLTLQLQWAKEHALTVRQWPRLPLFSQYTDRLPLYRILEAQIAEFQPDILYCQNLTFCDPVFLKKLKRQVKLVVGQIACPLPPSIFLKPFDLILTSFPHFVPRLQAMGIQAEYFKIGFEERLVPLLADVTEKKYDVVFIGGFSKVHRDSAQALEQLASVVPIDVWGYGIETLPAAAKLRERYHGEAWALDMYRIITQAKICINRHSSAAANYANNMRLFETTGLGTFLLTDQKQNLADLFAINQEVVAYGSADELISKVRYYLKQDVEREAIAKAGQQRTLQDHTYRQRMLELDQILKRYL